jgi:BirA family biotin operon repressor/biotin-[acetyl-CoA-carboxylase] ligase
MPAIGNRIIRLASVDSTNNYAAKGIAAGELDHGTVILARDQTAGQGQRGRDWITAPGLDIAMSVVLLPENLPVPGQFNLAKAAALAVHDVVADVLRQAGLDAGSVRIKWPNDVLIDRRKVAGILIANELQGNLVASAIVGIGMNVNSTGLDNALGATSLLLETGTMQDTDAVALALCARLEHWWQRLDAVPGEVEAAYAERLWAKGRFAAFTLDDAEFTARPLEVDAMGRLIVEDELGRVAAYGLERLRFKR